MRVERSTTCDLSLCLKKNLFKKKVSKFTGYG